MPDDANVAEAWVLTLADQTLVMTKNGANRLGFAVLLLFYRANGRFPKKPIEIDEETVGCGSKSSEFGLHKRAETTGLQGSDFNCDGVLFGRREPPRVKLAGAEAVPGRAGSASADGLARSLVPAGFCQYARHAGYA